MNHLLEVHDLVTEIDTPYRHGQARLRRHPRPWTGARCSGSSGESGSGKSMLVRSIMGLLPPEREARPTGTGGVRR